MRHFLLVGLVGLVGCGGGASQVVDASTPDAFPDHIQIGGVASSRATPIEGITVGVYLVADPSTPIASAQTDAVGRYQLTLATHGAPVSAFLEATSRDYVATYRVFDRALSSEFYPQADFDLLTPTAYAQLYAPIQGGRIAGTTTYELDVLDNHGSPVSDATFQTSPDAPSQFDRVAHVGFILNARTALSVEPITSSFTFTPADLFGFADGVTLATLYANPGAD